MNVRIAVGLAAFAFTLVSGAAPTAIAGPQTTLAFADEGLKFEIYKDKAEEFRWRLKAANGKVLATPGDGYKSKDSCKKAVELIRSEAAGKLTFEVYEDKGQEFRWRLKSGNGQVVASSSEGYKAKADCEKAVELIKKGAAKAEVTEEK